MMKNFKNIEHKFYSIIKEVDRIISPLINSIKIEDISKFNLGYKAYNINKFKFFVENEKNRFLKALDIIVNSDKNGVVCDLGCFIPYLPIALATLGFKVKIVDKYELYGVQFKNSILNIAKTKNIDVVNLDIINDNFYDLGKNDIVLLMAVVEHLNGSPRELMEKIYEIIYDDGFLLFEVPNIANFVNRIKFLIGRSPLPNYETYFYSGYPFGGHNREMTVYEVYYLLKETNFNIELLECYDYSRDISKGTKIKIIELIKNLTPIANKGQSIIVKAHPNK